MHKQTRIGSRPGLEWFTATACCAGLIPAGILLGRYHAAAGIVMLVCIVAAELVCFTKGLLAQRPMRDAAAAGLTD